MMTRTGLIFCILLIWTTGWAQKDKAVYKPEKRSGVIEEISREADSLQTVEDSVTSSIRSSQPQGINNLRLRFDIEGLDRPKSLEEFKTQFHFPPLGQFKTGTCWCFSTTSFIETEMFRQTGQKIKLSEMFTVYYEYVEKARHFVQTRAHDWNWEGSESNAVLEIMKHYGAVPSQVYTGHVDNRRFDHNKMAEEINAYFEFVDKNNLWDENVVVGSVKLILDKYMGEPPRSFIYNDETITPREFLSRVMKINLDDFVCFMSTLQTPFYTQGKYDVEDNWRDDSTYYNIPLEDWYNAIKLAIIRGYTVELGGDISEPGYIGDEDIAIIPDFDIPQSYINQDSRELRFYNETSTDDHGIHIVGYVNRGEHDWFLIKDSSRRLAQGKFEGYVFYRDDYIKLKMLVFMAHKDALDNGLKKRLGIRQR
jgi:bleomycin hydrolase